ncbi:hypothetical protein [Natronolimnohabitans innermongolicus]|uniref:DUF8135 domain-containing protein n=1 Tax=Natronolimnohabitans innermongolicus JCM 12255 TaxID=1227499 RepID=L9WLI2_9EURY|nr:hypothetical protein [Natronolimnohabitans innermongolicus]ELY49213.1 hypothetical protein C493_20992 [Natronolimnohabitans innermongolicus JCM 12255]
MTDDGPRTDGESLDGFPGSTDDLVVYYDEPAEFELDETGAAADDCDRLECDSIGPSPSPDGGTECSNAVRGETEDSDAVHRRSEASGTDAGPDAARTGDRSEPLDELVTAVGDADAPRDDRSSGDPAVADRFERENVSEIDAERLWERLEGIDATTGRSKGGFEFAYEDAPDAALDDAVLERDRDRAASAVDSSDADESATETASNDREYREIDKRSYCHQCEYFATPPAVACTHDGTDILELSSTDTFRVADCPRVLADEALEERE